MRLTRFIFLSLYLVIILICGTLFTQTANAVSSSSIILNISPENPSPNENTVISLNSYASNLDSVPISWYVNGKKTLSGIGKKSFSISAPSTGDEIIVTVTISLPDGEIERAVTIRPAFMLLLWQANDSYVPPFYRGRALPTPDSQIKIVAIPEIKNGANIINPKNMVYNWKQDYTNMPEASGYGKSSFVYLNDYLENSSNISVVASTTDQKYSSSASINVGTSDVKVLFYKKDPILGTIWEHTLTDGHIIKNDEIIEAAPYFISPKDIRIPILSWIWSINGDLIDIAGFQKNLIPLKTQEGVSGTAKIRLEIENKYKIFGTANKEISVTF